MARHRDVGNENGQHARARDITAVRAAERERIAVQMRMQGKDFDAIAEACGYGSRASAYKAWKRAIQRIPQAEADEARRSMRIAYDAMRSALYPNVVAGKTWAIEAWLKVDERESKLMGLDKPQNEATSAEMVLIGLPQDVLNAV